MQTWGEEGKRKEHTINQQQVKKRGEKTMLGDLGSQPGQQKKMMNRP